MTARGLKMFLELSGYEVETANTMRAALKAAASTQFDVLLCDLNLPDGTGWELMERLRKRIAVRGIAYSAFDEPEHVARSKAAGFIDHVVKGATPEDLVAAIDRAVAAAVNPSADGADAAPARKTSASRGTKRSRANPK